MLLPRLFTSRLLLRPLDLGDAVRIRQLAGNRAVAATTLRIPHPYPEGAAEQFIGGLPSLLAAEKAACFGIVLQEEGLLCGCVGFDFELEHDRAELGYWVGVPYWGRGIATEAVNAAVEYGFGFFNLNRITASCFADNAPSLRVLEKCGFEREGVLRQHVKKWNRYTDLVACALLRR